jgi:hypothetical protein
MPKSVVAGIAGSARIQRLKVSQLRSAQKHGLRLDESSKARKVRDAPPLTTTGLDLVALRDHHIEGAMVPKGETVALHMLLQFPTDLVDGDDGEWMLDHARKFAATVFGDRAIFADRMDRDEAGMHIVDLFLAPRYVKKTKHSEKEAVSISKHLKDLAVATGRWEKEKGNPEKSKDPPLVVQGQALQDVWFEYLRSECQLDGVARGSQKRTKDGDWMPAEQLDIVRRQEAAQASWDYSARQEKSVIEMLDQGEVFRTNWREAEAEAARQLKVVQAQVAETAARQRQADAFTLGVEAWIAGDVAAAQKEDGSKVLRYRDVPAMERLNQALQPAFEQLWNWMTKAAKAVADRVSELVKAATVDREQAAKDMVTAATQVAAAKAEADRVAELVKAATVDREQAAKDRVAASTLSASAKLDAAAVTERVKAAAVDREQAARDRADAAVIKQKAGDQAVEVARLMATAANERDQAAADRARAAALVTPQGVQRAVEARVTKEAVERAAATKVTPQLILEAAAALVTPELVQDVLAEKVTAARAVNSALNAALFARHRGSHGM